MTYLNLKNLRQIQYRYYMEINTFFFLFFFPFTFLKEINELVWSIIEDSIRDFTPNS